MLSWSWSLIPTWPLETQRFHSLTTIHTVYILGLTKIGLNIGGCVSHVIYLIVSDCCLGPEGFSQLNHLKFRASKPSHQFIHLWFVSHPDRVKYGGCVSLVIYLIVSSFCIGPEASSQHHHLKIRASKSWQQFIEWIFWSHPKRVWYRGVFIYLYYSLWLLSKSLSFIPTWPFETQSIRSLTIIH